MNCLLLFGQRPLDRFDRKMVVITDVDRQMGCIEVACELDPNVLRFPITRDDLHLDVAEDAGIVPRRFVARSVVVDPVVPIGHASTISPPLLTPLDSPIFDEDVIADLEAHFDDDLACAVDDCGKAASVSVAMRCCSTRTWTVCDEHLQVGRRQAERALASMLFRGRRPRCVGCGHRFASGAVFEDVYSVVEL